MSYKHSFGLLAVLITTNTSVFSQTLEESQALDLGRIAIIDNGEVGTIFINKDSFISVSGGVRILAPGRPAIFEARGFDANRRLFISVQANQAGTVTSEVSQEQFTVQAYDAEEFVTTDAQGNVDFVVGARFATSGSGSENFRDTVYSATYTVTVNY